MRPDGVARLEVWLRERELGSDNRAGRWARGQARRRQAAFAKRNWWVLVLILLITFLLMPLVFLMPADVRAFAAGAIAASGVWLAVLLVVLSTGTAGQMMGDAGEQWTASELRRLRRRGWHVANQLALRSSEDIDHVVVGPGGLLVIETKWRSHRWDLAAPNDRVVAEAAQQALRNAKTVTTWLRPALGGSQARPVVVAWGPEIVIADGEPISVDGVTVMPGRELRRWVDSLPDQGLEPSQVSAAWEQIDAHIRRRDAADVDAHGPPPTSWGRGLALVVGVVVAALFSLVATTLAISAFGVWPGALGVELVNIAIGVLATRASSTRPFGFAWLLGTAGSLFLIMGAAITVWIT